jgi:hypothetical protein
VREVYDRFLAKFPLFFGYWKKYADLEFSIAGTEAAEMVTYTTTTPTLANVIIGLRTRRRQHHQLCRSMDQLLLLQDRDQPRRRYHPRVSIAGSSLLHTHQQPWWNPMIGVKTVIDLTGEIAVTLPP